MASMTIFVGDVAPARTTRVDPVVRPARKWTTLDLQQAICQIAGNLLVLGLLGWEAWRIGGRLLQLAILVTVGATGSGPIAPAVESFWPNSGRWPW